MSSEIAIRVDNLSKCYHIYDKPHDRLKQSIFPQLQRVAGKQPKQYFREFWALKDVSFEVNRGETVGIIGRNGSGKSTLLQLICGTLNPTHGNIKTNGRIAALLELGSGFNPEFTGRENVYMNGAVLGLSKEEIDTRFDDIAAFANIGAFMDQPVKTYSSGMAMRLAFAISACIDPEILVVDEALSVGDAAFQYKCLERMERLRKSGATLILVSHDMGMILSFCSRVIYLQNGIFKAQGDSGHVAELYFRDIRDDQRQLMEGIPIQSKSSISGSEMPAFGTEQGSITQACFLPDKVFQTCVSCGDVVRLRIGYEYDMSLSSVSVSIYLNDSRMLDVSGKYFYVTPEYQKEGLSGGILDIEFEAKLKPGRYFITVRLECSRVGETCFPVDKQPGALSFEVVGSDVGFLGTVDMDMRLAMKDKL